MSWQCYCRLSALDAIKTELVSCWEWSGKQSPVSETNSLKTLQLCGRKLLAQHGVYATNSSRTLSAVSALSITFGGCPMERDILAIFQVQ